MVRRFRNKVRISEVQEEFDKLCSRIDNLNQIITDVQGFGDDFDYSTGSSQLSPSGYTLTVGGLKTALNGADGKVVGAKAFRLNSNQIKMTTGMLVTKDGAYKLPDSVLTVPNDKRTLYYNTTTKQYQWTGTGTESVVVERTKHIGSEMVPVDGGFGNGYYYLPVYDDHIEDRDTTFTDNTVSPYWNYAAGFYKYDEADVTARMTSTSVPLPIGKYAHTLCNLKSGGSVNWEMNAASGQACSGMIMGYLDGEGIFTPKIYICCETSSIYFKLLIGLQPQLRKLSNAIEMTFGDISRSISSQLRLGPRGSTYVGFQNNGSNTRIECISYSATHDNSDYLGTLTIPNNIEDYNINCVIYQGKVSATPSSGVAPTTASECYLQSDYSVHSDATQASLANLNVTGQDLTYYETIEVPSDTAAYRVCDINMNRDSIYVSDHLGIQCENIYGTYKIQSESRQYSGDWKYNANGRSELVAGHWHWGQIGNGFIGYEAANNSSAPKFIVPLEPDEMDDGLRYEAYFSDKRISYNKCRPRGADNWYAVANFFYLPKGAPCPFNYKMQQGDNTWNPAYYNVRTTVPAECSSQKSYNVKISKTLKQKTS